MPTTLNVAAYRFAQLDDPAQLRASLEQAALARGLKGTILLATEGINLCLAGPAAALRGFIDGLRQHAAFADLTVKESWSARQPFRRLRVRVRAEIIRMNDPTIRPQLCRAPVIDARTLKRWLDRGCDDGGRPLLLLDTRNDYEVRAGRFAGALELGLRSFSEFPGAVERVYDTLRQHAVVSYCTGGIRCEKAALHLERLGLVAHWQLDGGILRYFEEVGGAHFDGACTVFDEREALGSDLEPAAAVVVPLI